MAYNEKTTIALAGNPNVGKSTVFNALTGLKQHTGNWAGKTVDNASGTYFYENNEYEIFDLPGTYSLLSNSVEEELARDFLCFSKAKSVIVVCDATTLERNLNLVLQIMEIGINTICLVNLMDEAKKKKISFDFSALSNELGIPFIASSARQGKGLDKLLSEIKNQTLTSNNKSISNNKKIIKYDENMEKAIDIIFSSVDDFLSNKKIELNTRWVCVKILENNKSVLNSFENFTKTDILQDINIKENLEKALKYLNSKGICQERLKDLIAIEIVNKAESIAKKGVFIKNDTYSKRDRIFDKIITGKFTAIPFMLLMLGIIFWITIEGANYPSTLLSDCLFWIGDRLFEFFNFCNLPIWLNNCLINGIYKVVAWVVAVMLPPMAIFFPLFTLLEDLGVLPRIAFNLDKCFKKANSCGKQALTMCMGFGCNAAAITGCRIIDSKRERLIAILTNNFVPCNGRFPTIISIITLFFVGASGGFLSSISSTFILMCVIICGILMTFLISKFLSKTFLKGVPSSFTLELPPYRAPQIGKVIVRSIFDRTLFVLARAVCIAAPAGLIIWLCANVFIGDVSILNHLSSFFDPFAKLMGLDGVILLAFILGFPANEIVVPIIIMAYLSTGSIMEFDNIWQLKELLLSNGWTITTAICLITFSLFHFPCSTTILTIKKETKSIKWTIFSFILPTIIGITICIIINTISHLFC